MSKKNNEAATKRSMSSATIKNGKKVTPTGCNQEKEKIMHQNNNPVFEHINGGSSKDVQKKLNAYNRLFIDIARKMVQGKTCMAIIANELYNEYLAENEIYQNNLTISAEQTIEDAEKILHVMELINADIYKEHDNAVKVLTEIMSRHAPGLLKVWAEFVKRGNSK